LLGNGGAAIGNCPQSSALVNATVFGDSEEATDGNNSHAADGRRLNEPRCYVPWLLVHVGNTRSNRSSCLYRWGVGNVQSPDDIADVLFLSTWSDAYAMYVDHTEGQQVDCYESSVTPYLSLHASGFPGNGETTWSNIVLSCIGICIPFLLCLNVWYFGHCSSENTSGGVRDCGMNSDEEQAISLTTGL